MLVANQIFDTALHPATLHRYPKSVDTVWRRVAPTLKIKDPHYKEKRLAIEHAVTRTRTDHPVFHQDEVDIDLNPKISSGWMFKGQHKRITTPGHNQKHYIQTRASPLRRRQQ